MGIFFRKKQKASLSSPKEEGGEEAAGSGDGVKRQKANPYLNARRAHNDRESSLLSAKVMWQALALVSLMIALAAVGGIISIGSQSKFIPYVVAVDSLGTAVAVGRADRASPVDKRVMVATLASFIADARMVTPDTELQRQAIFRVFAHMLAGDPAILKINEWYGAKETNPFERAALEAVSTEIISTIQQTEETWQVEWRESVRDKDGALRKNSIMRALVAVYVNPPSFDTTDEQMRMNPLGIYIKDYNWARQK